MGTPSTGGVILCIWLGIKCPSVGGGALTLTHQGSSPMRNLFCRVNHLLVSRSFLFKQCHRVLVPSRSSTVYFTDVLTSCMNLPQSSFDLLRVPLTALLNKEILSVSYCSIGLQCLSSKTVGLCYVYLVCYIMVSSFIYLDGFIQIMRNGDGII